MTNQNLDHLFTSAKNIPIETSATEIASWVAATAVTSTGVLGVVAKLKLIIAKKSIMIFGITLGTVGVTALSIALVSSPSEKEEQKENLPHVTSQFVDDYNKPETSDLLVLLDDTLYTPESEEEVKVDPVAPIAPVSPVAPIDITDPVHSISPVSPIAPTMARVMVPKNTFTFVSIATDPIVDLELQRAQLVLQMEQLKAQALQLTAVAHQKRNKAKKGPKVTGDGKVTKQTREVKPFTEIKFEGMFDVSISQGATESVTVETDGNLQEYVLVENDGSTLVLKNKSASFKKITEMKIYVVVKDLTKISGSGMGDLVMESTLKLKDLTVKSNGVGDTKLNLECTSLDLHYNGVGDVEIEGKATTVKMNCTGVGDIEAYDFKVKDMTLVQSGVGDTKVNVTGDLNIVFSGVGSVYYKDGPETKSIKNSGIGTVKAK